MPFPSLAQEPAGISYCTVVNLCRGDYSYNIIREMSATCTTRKQMRERLYSHVNIQWQEKSHGKIKVMQ